MIHNKDIFMTFLLIKLISQKMYGHVYTYAWVSFTFSFLCYCSCSFVCFTFSLTSTKITFSKWPSLPYGLAPLSTTV